MVTPLLAAFRDEESFSGDLTPLMSERARLGFGSEPEFERLAPSLSFVQGLVTSEFPNVLIQSL